jgi:predicted N-acetyltransferase YhbS
VQALNRRFPGAHAHLQAEQQDVTTIFPLETQNAQAIEEMLDAAFGADRHGRTAYAIRRGMRWLPELSFACLDDEGVFVGLLQSWPVALVDNAGRAHPLIMVGPVAVLPARQGDGYGKALMDAMMAKAHACKSEPLIMIGDPEYYGRFWGFSAEQTVLWQVPGPVEQRRLLAVSPSGEALPQAGMLGPRMKQHAA